MRYALSFGIVYYLGWWTRLRWHFAIVMTGKGKRFYTRSSCRVIIKSGIILQFTAFVELINVSSRSPRREAVSTSLPLSPFLDCNTGPLGEFETRNKKFKSRRLLSECRIAACAKITPNRARFPLLRGNL